MGIELGNKVQEYFQDENHRKDFEDWYFKKYGIKYEWRDK